MSLSWESFVWVCGFTNPVKAERRREYLADEKMPMHAGCGRCGGRPVRPWEQRP